jgi:hypothetical protein
MNNLIFLVASLTKTDCDQIKDNPVEIDDHETLQEENWKKYYDDGFEDGQSSNRFNEDKDNGCDACSNSYENGFDAGCQSVEGIHPIVVN